MEAAFELTREHGLSCPGFGANGRQARQIGLATTCPGSALRLLTVQLRTHQAVELALAGDGIGDEIRSVHHRRRWQDRAPCGRTLLARSSRPARNAPEP